MMNGINNCKQMNINHLLNKSLFSVNFFPVSFDKIPETAVTRESFMKLHSVLKTAALLLLLTVLSTSFLSEAESQSIRRNINIPEIPGYSTVFSDFHMHTVFSDGSVWPTVRPEEAWREGLDAISITDHIEYQPKKDDVNTDHNRSYEIARERAESLNLMLIRGTEITRDEPEGHHNAIFIRDANKIDIEDFMKSMQEAHNQGGFIFWNHPGWKQPGYRSVWYDIQNELFEKGLLHGIEVANGDTYYPNAHKWCLEKGMTMIGVSDIHAPINMNYDISAGEMRPMTLVFARNRTEEPLKEALFERRTAVYWKDILIGEEQFLRPIYEQSVSVKTPAIKITGDGSANVQVSNSSDIPYTLQFKNTISEINLPEEVILESSATTMFRVRGTDENRNESKLISIPVTVKNLYVQPEQGMETSITIHVTFIPEKK